MPQSLLVMIANASLRNVMLLCRGGLASGVYAWWAVQYWAVWGHFGAPKCPKMPLGAQSVCPLDRYSEKCLEMTVTGLVGLYFYLFVAAFILSQQLFIMGMFLFSIFSGKC